MPRRKHIKLAEVRTFSNVFDYKQENVEDLIISYFFQRNEYLNSLKEVESNFTADNEKADYSLRTSDINVVTLELGCGQADYSINLAKLYPHRKFIGIDRKAARLWNASKNATEAGLKNVVFLIAYIEKLIEVFNKIKVEEIWITFPDPYPRRSSMKKRLVHPRFLEIYKKLLLPNGKIFLKTDDETLYAYTLNVIEEENLILHKAVDDLYQLNSLTEEEKIQTKYEKQHLSEGKKIKLVSFSFP